MPTLAATAVEHARTLVLRLLAEARLPEHKESLWLAACGRRPPRAGAVPYYYLTSRAEGLPAGEKRRHLVRAAVDALVAEGRLDAWRSRAKNGRHRCIWVRLKAGAPAGPRCPCCGCDLSDLFDEWEGDG